MKVLLFTHEQDIDGMGCAVLAKKAFNDLEVVPCKTFEITSKVKEYIDNKRIYEFDKVFVTDLCIKEPVLTFIDNDEILRNKLIVLDHHKTEIEEGNDKYDFVNVIVTENGIKKSGTSLFYDYLIDNSYLVRSNVMDEFAEFTRQYDVWDWKSINNYDAHKLHILFEVLGLDRYVEIMSKKLDTLERITFDTDEEKVISDFNNKLDSDIENILSGMKVYELEIDGTLYRIGYVHCIYKYRNDINEYVKADNKYDVDVVGMIMTDTDTVSYRLVKDIDASKIAVYFGGKGHKAAATNSQDNEKFKLVLKIFN